jgi:hypothetical protein
MGPSCMAAAGRPEFTLRSRMSFACRAFINRSLERLGLNVEAVKAGPGRPATSMGWTGGQ